MNKTTPILETPTTECPECQSTTRTKSVGSYPDIDMWCQACHHMWGWYTDEMGEPIPYGFDHKTL